MEEDIKKIRIELKRLHDDLDKTNDHNEIRVISYKMRECLDLLETKSLALSIENMPISYR